MLRFALTVFAAGMLAAQTPAPAPGSTYVQTPYGRMTAGQVATTIPTRVLLEEVSRARMAARTEADIAAREAAAEQARSAAFQSALRARWQASPEGQAAAEAAAERRDAAVVKFQREQALAGSARCQYELGLRHLAGNGVARDAAAARLLLARAAEQGHEEAKAKLATLPAEPEAKAP